MLFCIEIFIFKVEMIQKSLTINICEKLQKYSIEIGYDLLKNCGDWSRKILGNAAKKIAIVSNKKVFRIYGEKVKNSLEKSGFNVVFYLMNDGEKYKNLRVLETVLAFFSENKLARNDAVVALGGGVVGDLAGFASAIYLRGIRFLQIPTTLLAMIDSSVGGKTAVNSDFGKNLIGAFHQPAGVLIDAVTLKTLPKREVIAGLCEAVKQGAIADKSLFNQTADFLKKKSQFNLKNKFTDEIFLTDLANLIAGQINFKAEIVAGDERENVERSDAKSRKILNFGHTVAHALEKITSYKYFRHGEAVGYGILAAGEIAKNVGIFDKDELKLLNGVVALVGELPNSANIEVEKIIEAFEFDKKSSGNNLEWILLKKIGEPVIFDSNKISPQIIKNSLETVLGK